jgi:hypothetical protein
LFSARELIKLAKAYTSNNKTNTAIKKSVKEEDKSKNRSVTKKLIHEERTDELSPKEKAKSGNIWNWD